MTSFVFGEKVGRWVCEKAGGDWTHLCTAIGIETDGKMIAGLMYDGYTGPSIACHSRCDEPQLVTREFYRVIFDYPFNQLHVKRLTGLVSSANIKAQRVNEKLGFRRETTLSDYFPDGDGIVYIMRREDCRFLRDSHAIQPLRSAA